MFCNIDTYDISIPEDNNIMVIYIDTYTIRSINRYHVNNTGLIIGRLISWLIDNNTIDTVFVNILAISFGVRGPRDNPRANI